ncbi:MAG: hypothetical protein H7836_08010 [Magnetococcus sp. YQC-3]
MISEREYIKQLGKKLVLENKHYYPKYKFWLIPNQLCVELELYINRSKMEIKSMGPKFKLCTKDEKYNFLYKYVDGLPKTYLYLKENHPELIKELILDLEELVIGAI